MLIYICGAARIEQKRAMQIKLRGREEEEGGGGGLWAEVIGVRAERLREERAKKKGQKKKKTNLNKIRVKE